jgi:exopolysaccharide production protein ExoQ
VTPQTAFLACTACACAALVFDARKNPQVSAAVWIVVIWTSILASRPVTAWFDLDVRADLMVSQDGTELDRNLLVLMMFAAGVILARRHPPWARLAQQYKWILIFLLFCGISVLWSDFVSVGLKRWFRAIGALMVILVVATEKDPVASAAAVIRRCSIVLLPFSVLLIKYYRNLGTVYNGWTGQEYLVGVATDKNALGRLCLVFGIFALWEILTRSKNPHLAQDRISKWGSYGILGFALWLLATCDSKTSLSCFLVGGAVIAVLGLPVVRGRARYLGTLALVFGGTALLLNETFDLQDMIFRALGRNPTLTDRTFIWSDLRAMHTNPIFGVGYDTFWLGSRLQYFLEKYEVNSAHNGYLEIYLEVGALGLLLLLRLLLSVFSTVKTALLTDAPYGRLLAATLAVFAFYNITEAGYKPTALVSFVLLLMTLAAPAQVVEAMAQASRRVGVRINRSKPVPAATTTSVVAPARPPNGRGRPRRIPGRAGRGS